VADLDYASPRPPRKSDSAVISAWCTSLGIPPIVLLIVLRLFHVQVPLGFQAFVPAILLIALAAIGCGLVSSASVDRTTRTSLANWQPSRALVRGNAGMGGTRSCQGIAHMIDLYSDTLTKPTPAMRRAMAEAEVADEQRREDPTTNRLQQTVAELLGKEAAVFCPAARCATPSR
jgi:hypothetical protein